MKVAVASVVLLCLVSSGQSSAITRLFTANFEDMRTTLHRYAYCYGDYPPYKTDKMGETEFLVHQMKEFLDQGNYDNEQLSNVTMLMDNICRVETLGDQNYPISMSIDINKYSGPAGKDARCKSIDETLNSMYYVFRRAAWNQSEPLDFSTITFYANASDKSSSYNLTDLVNTSWIKSDTWLENICKITDSIKEYVTARAGNSTAQDRAQLNSNGASVSLMAYIDALLDRIYGFQRRMLLEGSNTVEWFSTGVSRRLGAVRSSLSSTRARVANYLFSGNSTNSTTTKSPTSHEPITLNKTRVPDSQSTATSLALPLAQPTSPSPPAPEPVTAPVSVAAVRGRVEAEGF